MNLGELRWPDVRSVTEQVVVLPLGSLEQHGHHLPLLTDSLIGGEIARRAAEILGEEALFLPILWVGASEHHRAYPGTVSLSNAVYADVLLDLLESLIGSGFRRIFLLNAHGGNIVPGQMALYDVQNRHRDMPDLWLAFASWWQIAEPQIAAIDALEQKNITHACEQETSMILQLRPYLVRMAEARGANHDFLSAFYVPDFHRPSRVDVPRMFEQITRSGAIGHPEKGTPEKGEALFVAAAQEIVAFVREFATWPPLEPR